LVAKSCFHFPLGRIVYIVDIHHHPPFGDLMICVQPKPSTKELINLKNKTKILLSLLVQQKLRPMEHLGMITQYWKPNFVNETKTCSTASNVY